MSNKDKVTVKIINKATQEIIAEFNSDEYSISIGRERIIEINTRPKSCDNCTTEPLRSCQLWEGAI